MTVSGISSDEKSPGTCSGKNWAQNFSASICVAWLNAPAKKSESVPARDCIRRRLISPRPWASEIAYWRISLPRMPAA